MSRRKGGSGNPDEGMIRMAEMMKAASVADSASTLTNDSGDKVLSMAEKAAAKKAQRRAEAAAKKDAKPVEEEGGVVDVAKELAAGTDRPPLNDAQKLNAAARMATGVLASEKRARDVKIVGFSLSLHSAILVEDTTIELNWGQRYGLIGRNGCGKSTFLQCVAAREVPIPEHIDTYLLAEEAKPSEATALEYVISRCVARGRQDTRARAHTSRPETKTLLVNAWLSYHSLLTNNLPLCFLRAGGARAEGGALAPRASSRFVPHFAAPPPPPPTPTQRPEGVRPPRGARRARPGRGGARLGAAHGHLRPPGACMRAPSRRCRPAPGSPL
jgi:hypothetical protein